MRYNHVLFLCAIIILLINIISANSDFNGDWKVNNNDRSSFLTALNSFPIGTSGCLPVNNFCNKADIDVNGKVELKDLQDFISAHFSSCTNYDPNYHQVITTTINAGTYNGITCSSNNNLCVLLDINQDSSLNNADESFMNNFKNSCNFNVTSRFSEVMHLKFENNFNDETGLNNGASTNVNFVPGPFYEIISGFKKVGLAGDFSGATDVVTIPDSPSLDGMTSITLGGWVYVYSFNTYNTIIVKRNSYLLTLTNTGRVSLWKLNPVNNVLTSTGSVSTGSWHHVLAISNSTGSYAYIDGSLAGTGASLGAIPNNNDPVEIGYRNLEGIQPFNGAIDEIMIWNKSIREDEIILMPSLPECSDSIDNDGDSRIDASSILDPNNLEITSAGPNPLDVAIVVNRNITAKSLPYTKISPDFLIRSNGDWERGNDVPHMPTLNKVCEIFGFSSVKSHTCQTPIGSCNFQTPEDNVLWRFDASINNFRSESAAPKSGKSWLAGITCEHRLAKCKDNVDNDGDGLKDSSDPECISNGTYNSNFDSENPDFGCFDSNDYVELDNINQCSDGHDNDNDGLRDSNDPDCWTNQINPNTYNTNDNAEIPAAQCSDGIDNDGDSLADRNDPGCNFAGYNPNDNVETTSNQCSDGHDNDNDGLIDRTDSHCWFNPSDPNTYDPTNNDESLPIIITDKAYFADMKNLFANLTTAEQNDLVRLVVTGDYLTGQNISYTIYKSVPFWFDSKVAQTSTTGFLTWRAGKKNGNIFETGGFYFKAKIANLPEIISNILTVTDPDLNDPPIANITSPKNKQIYFLNELLTISQNSYDRDDEFNFVWNLGNGEIKSGDSRGLANYQFDYSYNTTGQKNIRLTVTDERGEKHEDQISILVIDSDFILAYIDLPRLGFSYDKTVRFDASSTYAVKETITNGNRQIECIAGNCPTQTAGCPPPLLGCTLPITDSPKGFNNISFSWIFDNNPSKKFNATGITGLSFNRTFSSPGIHTAELTASINPSSTTSTTFGVYFNDPVCVVVDDDNQVFFPNSFLGQSFWVETDGKIVNSQNNCSRPTGVNNDGEIIISQCCPVGFSCSNNICIPDGKTKCEEFLNQTSCEDVNNWKIADRELDDIVSKNFENGCNFFEPYGDVCAEYISCVCEWSTSASSGDKCQAVSNHKVKIITSNVPFQNWDYTNLPADITNICNSVEQLHLKGKCIFTITYSGSCESGDSFIKRSWKADWSTISDPVPDYCKDETDTISCGDIVKLDFFSFWNLIIVVLFIIIFYYFYAKKYEDEA